MTLPALGTPLNTAQRQAVDHDDGPLLVLAGAGSGKTRVLTSRIARLVESRGVPPERILAVTFTNKAAGEMRERIGRQLGRAPAGLWIGTFHAIGARMLRLHADRVGRTREYTIYDEDDLTQLLRRLMERVGVSPREWSPKAVAAEISGAKNALVPPEEFARLAHTPLSKAAAPVYAQLEDTLRGVNAVSFDDLLVLPVRLLAEHADLRARYGQRFAHVLVDEYQDTNRAQYELVRLIAGPDGNVCVVGDDDQAIYGWRGADIRNILDFEHDFPSARVVRLEENYRSTPAILELANAVIAPNRGRRGKTLRATRPDGPPITLTTALDDRDEAEWVGDQAMRLSREGRGGELAILYRTNAQSRLFEEALRRRAVPYRVVGAVRFYDRREIRDLVAWLRLIANPADDEAFRRAVAAPRRGIGETTVELLATAARDAGTSLLDAARQPERFAAAARGATRLALAEFAAVVDRFRVAATDAPVDRLLTDLIRAIGYDTALKEEGPEGRERLENVAELVQSASEVVLDDGGEIGLRPLDHFLQRATLVQAADQVGEGDDACTLMTVHTAKGLEFAVVHLAGMEDGLFPLARAFDDPDVLEEERRLLYVAVTRAGDALHVSWARQRLRNGERLPSKLSSFLDRLEVGLVEPRETPRMAAEGKLLGWSTTPSARRPGTPVQREWMDDEPAVSQDLPRFVKGERVRHKTFGSGTIAELSGAGRDTKVVVDFDDETIGRKKLVVAFAGLERGFD